MAYRTNQSLKCPTIKQLYRQLHWLRLTNAAHLFAVYCVVKQASVAIAIIGEKVDYPDDEDGEVLKMLSENGVDMSAPINIEFAVHCPNESAADSINKALSNAGYDSEIVFDEGELDESEAMTEENEEFWPSWSVYADVKMIPEYDEIIRIQKELDDLSKVYGGKSDGWGVMH